MGELTILASLSIARAEVVDVEQFSEQIGKLEAKWQNDYEEYFNRNFANQSRSASKIAARLQEAREQTNVNPAVIWAVPKEDFLQLLLVTPERQFVA